MDVLEQIDFYKIREEVSRLCITEEGKNALSERKPLSDYKQIEILKSCSREWSHFISAGSSLPFNLWEPVKPLFEIIKTNGACLSLEQLYHIGQFCRAVEKTISLKTNIPAGCRGVFMTEGSPLFEEVTKLENLSEAFSVIFRIITQDGELKDLPEIAAIRKQIASLNQKIRTIMHGYVTDSKYQNILESNVPALKNGRQVLAIKAGQQNRINGIIHEVSGSGKTVFIEPEESVLCTNELIEKEFELKEEIKKVLTKATAELQPFVPVFRKNLPVMENLDCTYACAKYGIQNNCIYALPTLEEPPLLRQARHPLLGEKAVPIDIRFMDGKRVLIITGPNTGGKTVSLKTFALLSMMNQAGFPVPAEEGTRLPVFKNVFADIGDEQSLSQSLSTFSGHMKNIADACQNAGKYSLVLLDELGSGTDPQEGSAIAMAVLNHLIERKSFVLVTTHLGVLKNYGYTNENCINASVEFNSDTLSPSYKLLMGIPGESHALDIAARSGLPRFIVNNAKSYISTQQTDVSSLIKGLTKKHSELDRLRSQTDKEIQELEEKNLKLSEKEVNLRKKEHELKNNKTRELDEFIRKSRKELENLVRKIREGEITRDKTVSVKQFISELEANGHRLEDEVESEEEQIRQAELEIQKQSEKIRTSHKKNSKKKMKNSEALKYASVTSTSAGVNSKTMEETPLTFTPGTEVEVGTMKTRGTLISKDKKDLWTVQFGSIKMSVKQKDITLVKKAVTSNTVSVVVEKSGNGDDYPAFELRLLGMVSEEAVRALEHQLDLCTIHNFKQFSIIHGKGNGVLQQTVHDYLSHYDGIQDFRFAPPEDGGFGKTYVVLR